MGVADRIEMSWFTGFACGLKMCVRHIEGVSELMAQDARHIVDGGWCFGTIDRGKDEKATRLARRCMLHQIRLGRSGTGHIPLNIVAGSELCYKRRLAGCAEPAKPVEDVGNRLP
ncbi:hypothetical protein [Halobacterium sp. KA-6]|uniref:hypothetical protein n=1 Tax=Halobacterium sp. KA-6 TaxID=2896368 RepID=UPI001E2DD66F|nr:hypothetical protein [Halobacterium sp. KA-6]MCD2204944.1 hypothetical protein [Halobacterium sp. KA-6]